MEMRVITERGVYSRRGVCRLTRRGCVGQFVQASQVVVEDYAMSDAGMAPLKVVGYEGLFGTLAFAFLLPVAQVPLRPPLPPPPPDSSM